MAGVPQLPANSLFDVRLKKDQARQRAYNQILEQALQKVAHSAIAPNQPTFVISWAHHERQYLMEKNPIVQSMMPPKMAGPEKRRGASQVSLQQAATSTPNAGSSLRAADYTPPAGFVETMERPSPYAKPKQSVRFSDSKDSLGNVLDELWKI